MSKNVKVTITILAIIVLLLLVGNRVAKAAGSGTAGLAGAGRKSFLGKENLPRGIRNNNPGNLKMTDPRQGWRGSIDRSRNTDGVFEQFYYYTDGLRAMLKLMRNRMMNNGDNTIRKLIYTWAPPSENSTEEYIATVSTATGIPQNQVIDVYDKDRLFAIAQAIETQENGRSVMTRRDFNNAYANI